MSSDFNIILTEVQLLTVCNLNLLFYNIHTGNKLGDWMLNLHPSVHLHKVEFTLGFIKQKLNCTSIFIADRLSSPNSCFTNLLTQGFPNRHRWTFFQHLLIITLQRAIPLAQVDHMPLLICQNLHFNMARWIDDSLHIHGTITKGRFGFARCRLKGRY